MKYYQVTYKTKSQDETTLWLSTNDNAELETVMSDLQKTHGCGDIHAKPISFVEAKDLI